MDQIISWETAKLAKEKGFNIPVSRYYRDEKLIVNFEDSGCNEESYYFDADSLNENWNDGRVVNKDNNSCWGCTKPSYMNVYSASTQALLQRWLREVHNLHIQICIGTTIDKPTKCWVYYIQNDKGRTIQWNTNSDEVFNSYEEALEQGLINALNLINENTN